VAEYGDWEFFAANQGFDQKTGAGLLAASGNGRKFRGDGERGLRQQTANHMIALNDTLASPAVLDGQWAMFDYARGYDPMRAACGVMDIFRLPKFSHYFYRSQRDPREGDAGWTGGPMVFIASHWLPGSDLRVAVFTNCETVELRLNGERVNRVDHQNDPDIRHLPHPPRFFEVPHFVPGVIEATGFIGDSGAGDRIDAARRRSRDPAPRRRTGSALGARGIARRQRNVVCERHVGREVFDRG
jgi:beta-galactosidase